MGLRRKAARRVAPCKGAGGPKHCVCVCARARLSGVCACVFACACACVRACVCARARARSRVRYNPVVRPALCTQAGKRRPAGRVLRHRPTAWGGPLRAARGRVERPAAAAHPHTRNRGITAAATVRGDAGGGGGGRFVQGGFTRCFLVRFTRCSGLPWQDCALHKSARPGCAREGRRGWMPPRSRHPAARIAAPDPPFFSRPRSHLSNLQRRELFSRCRPLQQHDLPREGNRGCEGGRQGEDL